MHVDFEFLVSRRCARPGKLQVQAAPRSDFLMNPDSFVSIKLPSTQSCVSTDAGWVGDLNDQVPR